MATDALSVGETGSPPRNTSKRADATFGDSIVASTEEGIPSKESETFKISIKKSNKLELRKLRRKQKPHLMPEVDII